MFSFTNSSGPNTTTIQDIPTIVNRHRIVEIVPYSNDDYGQWVYPS